MYPARMKMRVDRGAPERIIFTDKSGIEKTVIETDKNDVLEELLATLGFKALVTQVDGEKTREKSLNNVGKTIILSITNQVEIDAAGERDWGCLAHVLVDGVVLGRFSFDTTSPLFHDVETAHGILKSLGIEIEIEDLCKP